MRALYLLLSVLISLPTLTFAKESCEKRMTGTYYAVPYSEPSGIHAVAISLLSDDPMNGKPNAYVEKRGDQLVHTGAVSKITFDTSGYDFAKNDNLFNKIAGNGATECGYLITGSSGIKVLYANLKKVDSKKVRELYDYFMEVWTRGSRIVDESRFITKVSTRKMTLEAFTNTTYFLYQEYSDGIVGVALLVPLEKK